MSKHKGFNEIVNNRSQDELVSINDDGITGLTFHLSNQKLSLLGLTNYLKYKIYTS